MKNLVSIISPCYNGAKYLRAFLDSVLAQSYDFIEMILIDDGSTDDTFEIAKSYNDKFKKRGYSYILLQMPSNSGQAAAINRGLSIFKGDYVMWMDSDDIFLEYAIEHKVDFLNNNPELDFCLNHGYVVSEDNTDKCLRVIKRKKPNGKDDLFSDLIYEKNVVYAPGLFFAKSSSLKRVIPSLHIFESREGQNWQLLLPLAYSCKYGYIEECLFKYVVHLDSHSHLKRNYEKEIERLDNFETLLITTICSINEMNSLEKEKWTCNVIIKTLRKKVQLANRYRKIKDFYKFKKELKKQGISLDFKDSFFIFPLLNLYEKIKHFIKNNKKDQL